MVRNIREASNVVNIHHYGNCGFYNCLSPQFDEMPLEAKKMLVWNPPCSKYIMEFYKCLLHNPCGLEYKKIKLSHCLKNIGEAHSQSLCL